jgi:hypothetical protein
MANNNTITISTNGDGPLDREAREYLKAYILGKARSLQRFSMPVNQSSLARVLGINRRRALHIVEALGITAVFDKRPGAKKDSHEGA